LSRSVPKLVVLTAIAAIVLGIYWHERHVTPATPGIVYIDAGIGNNAAPPAR
jgi:hypothetical protein